MNMILEDMLLSLGTLIGIIVKGIALQDSRTVWSRKSSGLNVMAYPVTALYPFYSLGLHVTFTVTLISFVIWCGIYLFRCPEGENWIGQTH